jgi:hypothetical protein
MRTEPSFASRLRGGGAGRMVGLFRAGSMERRADLGLSGQDVGKWAAFAHMETGLTRLGPDKSTQVVDFPRIAYVRLFWGGAENRRISDRGMTKRSLEPIWGRENHGDTVLRVKWRLEVLPDGQWGGVRNYAEKITAYYAFFRGFPRFYAQIRAVFTRFYAFLRVRPFFNRTDWIGRERESNVLPSGRQKRGNKLRGTGIITRTWITEALGETGGAMKENA